MAPTTGAGVGAPLAGNAARRLPSRSAGRTQPGRVRAAILPGSYRAREAAPDMIKSPSATLKAMKKSGLRDAVDAPVRPQVRPAHVGSRDPDDGTRRLHDRWRGALFEADVARTVKNRAPHVSLLCLAIHSVNLFAVLLVADLFEPSRAMIRTLFKTRL